MTRQVPRALSFAPSAVVLVIQQICTNTAATDTSIAALGGTRPALVQPKGAHVPAGFVAEAVGAASWFVGEWENRSAVVIGSRA